MFTDMVSLLKKGEKIDLKLLRNRFDRALIKKIGVINTPCSFWSSDPKINPLTKELVWAAILLEDSENFSLLKDIATTELIEKKRASGHHSQIAIHEHSRKNMEIFINELLELFPREDFRQYLENKIEKTTG